MNEWMGRKAVPTAESSAERNTSGYEMAKTVGGMSATANGLGSFLSPVGICKPSARKSVRPRTNPRNEVLMAKKEKPCTSAAAVKEVSLSVAGTSCYSAGCGTACFELTAPIVHRLKSFLSSLFDLGGSQIYSTFVWDIP